MPREIKTSLVLDGEKAFNKGLQSIDRELRVMSSQLGALTSGYDKNAVSVENLSAQNKIMQDRAEVSRNKVKALETAVQQSEQAYADALKAVGQFTDEQLKNEKAGISAAKALETAERTMDNYKIKLANAQKQLNKNQKELDANTKAIEDFEEAAKSSGKNTESIFETLKKSSEKIAESVKKAIPHIQAVATAAAKISFKAAEKSVKAFADTTSAAMAASVKAVTAYMSAIAGVGTAAFAAAESSREYRMDIAKLEQAAKSSGNSFQKMKQSLADITALTGEADSSIEALNNLMASNLSDNQIEQALKSLSGAVIKFPDTLKIESLSDSLQETLAQSKATGQFGELLERLGYNLESFDAGLIACTSTAERQQYVLNTLAKTGLAEISAEYQKANEAAIAYEKSQLQLEDSIAKIGEITLPVATKIKSYSAEFISSFAGMISGSQGANNRIVATINKTISDIDKSMKKDAPRLIAAFNNTVLTVISSINAALPSVTKALLPTLLNSFFGLVDGLIDQMPTLVPNIVTGGLVLFNGLIDGMNISTEKLISMLPDIIGGVITSIETNGPVFLEGSLKLFGNLLDGFGTIVDLIVPEIPRFIQTTSEKLISNIPIIVRSVVSIVSSVSKSIIDNLPLIVSSAVSIVKTLADTLVTAPNIKLIVNTAFDLLMTIVDTVVDNLDEIIDTAMTVVETLCTTLLTSENIEKVVSSGLTILIKLVNAIVDNIDRVFIAAETIITSLANELTKPERMQTMIDLGIQLLGEIIVGLCKIAGKFSGFCYNLQTELWNTVTSIDFGSLGKSILDGIVAGLTNSSFGLHNMLAKFADNWVTGIKDILGIHSPSTVMRDKVGKFLASGIIVGFEEGMHNAARTMAKAIPTDFAITPDVSVAGYSQFESYINGMNANYIPKAATYNNSQKTVQIYNHIIIENARLDSSQDIQETAEALADETNRILAGVGKETS